MSQGSRAEKFRRQEITGREKSERERKNSGHDARQPETLLKGTWQPGGPDVFSTQ